MAGLCSASREEGPTPSVEKEAGSAGLWDCFHPFCPPVSVLSYGAEVTAGVVHPLRGMACKVLLPLKALIVNPSVKELFCVN